MPSYAEDELLGGAAVERVRLPVEELADLDVLDVLHSARVTSLRLGETARLRGSTYLLCLQSSDTSRKIHAQ